MIEALLVVAVVALVVAMATFIGIWLDESRRPRLICLMYHRFASPERYARLQGTERVFTMPLDRFETQMAALARRGCHFATAAEAVAFVAGRETLPQPAVHVTIDDGSRSVLTEAAPVLRRHAARATLFLTTDPEAWVFREPALEPRLTDAELRGLDPAVIEVEAHGVTHRPLVELPDEELRRELTGARQAIARLFGREPAHLAIPGNWHDARVRSEARAAGYSGVFVSDAGGNRPGHDPWRIRRLNVEGCADAASFETLLTPFGAARVRFISALKRLPGRVLGPRRWLPLRARIRAVIAPEWLSLRALSRASVLMAVVVFAAVIWWLLAR